MAQMQTMPLFPRDEKGRAVSTRCPDSNCGGTLRYQTGSFLWPQKSWLCDGLTYKTDNGSLIACDQEIEVRG